MKQNSYLISRLLFIVELAQQPQAAPLKNILNTANSNHEKRYYAIKNAYGHTKSKSSNHNNTLQNIEVPKYKYKPLHFSSPSSRQQQLISNTNDSEMQGEINRSQLIELYHGTQSTTDDSRDIIIEEFSSQETSQTNTMNRMLNQDNSLFLNIITPPNNAGDADDSNQQEQMIVDEMQKNVSKNQKNLSSMLGNDQNECAPGTSHAMDNTVSNTNNEQNACVARSEEVIYPNPFNISSVRISYLHYIDIDEISSNVIRIEGDKEELKIDVHLRFQCNAQNRIVISGEDSKQIMKFNEKQWHSVCRILKLIRKFDFKVNQPARSVGDSILHRALYYLFKSTPTFSNLHIEYGDHDFDSVRVVMKPYVCGTIDLTSCLDDFVLSNMAKYAATANENENQSN